MSWPRRRLLGGLLAVVAVPSRAGGSRPAAPADPRPPPVPGPPAAAQEIHDRPLPHEPLRRELTAAYLAAHLPPGHPHPPGEVHMQPRAVALHWTGGTTAESAWQTFAPARLGGRPELAGAGALNVGAHFLVDRDGRVLRLVDETRVMRHVIGLNHCTIGIENVGDAPLGGPGRAPLTPAQVAANAALVRGLVARWPTIQTLFGHHAYRSLEGGPLFAERDPGYRTAKIDPGPAFVAAVRRALAPLTLGGPGTDGALRGR